MPNPIKLENADVQDLANLVQEYVCRSGSCHNEIDLLIKRFNLPYEYGRGTSGSFSARARTFSLVENLNETNTLLKVLSYIVEDWVAASDENLQNRFNGILRKYGLEIESKGKVCRLVSVSSSIYQHERDQIKSFIEKYASKDVLAYLNDAKNDLGSGQFDDCLDKCRKALEGLTNGKAAFSDSLTELVTESLLESGDNKERKKDAELLRAVYGFASTLGAHTSSTQKKPDLEQAQLGLLVTEAAVYFLLKRIEAAKTQSKNLEKWTQWNG